MADIRAKWKEKVIMFPTCATDEGNVKYWQILLHSGMTKELKKKLQTQGLSLKDIDAHVAHMRTLFWGISIPMQTVAKSKYKPKRLAFEDFPENATQEVSENEEPPERKVRKTKKYVLCGRLNNKQIWGKDRLQLKTWKLPSGERLKP